MDNELNIARFEWILMIIGVIFMFISACVSITIHFGVEILGAYLFIFGAIIFLRANRKMDKHIKNAAEIAAKRGI